MPRYFAFLRAINVGDRTVKMDQLRSLFESIGLTSVETFIASGNVIFQSPSLDPSSLERQIESHLQSTLGYPVPTLLRTHAELTSITLHRPFPPSDLSAPDHSLYVQLLSSPLPPDVSERVLQFRTPRDDFHLHGRELYWLSRGKISDSPVKLPLLERTLSVPTTSRNITTLRKLVAKFPPD